MLWSSLIFHLLQGQGTRGLQRGDRTPQSQSEARRSRCRLFEGSLAEWLSKWGTSEDFHHAAHHCSLALLLSSGVASCPNYPTKIFIEASTALKQGFMIFVQHLLLTYARFCHLKIRVWDFYSSVCKAVSPFPIFVHVRHVCIQKCTFVVNKELCALLQYSELLVWTFHFWTQL